MKTRNLEKLCQIRLMQCLGSKNLHVSSSQNQNLRERNLQNFTVSVHVNTDVLTGDSLGNFSWDDWFCRSLTPCTTVNDTCVSSWKHSPQHSIPQFQIFHQLNKKIAIFEMNIPFEAATITPLKHNRKKLSRFSLQNRLFCLYRLLAVIKLHMHIIYHLLVTIWFYVSSMFIPPILLMFVQSKSP